MMEGLLVSLSSIDEAKREWLLMLACPALVVREAQPCGRSRMHADGAPCRRGLDDEICVPPSWSVGPNGSDRSVVVGGLLIARPDLKRFHQGESFCQLVVEPVYGPEQVGVVDVASFVSWEWWPRRGCS